MCIRDRCNIFTKLCQQSHAFRIMYLHILNRCIDIMGKEYTCLLYTSPYRPYRCRKDRTKPFHCRTLPDFHCLCRFTPIICRPEDRNCRPYSQATGACSSLLCRNITTNRLLQRRTIRSRRTGTTGNPIPKP